MKSRYMVFVGIGVELIAYIIIAIYLGEYLVEKQGISQDRFIFSYGEEGEANTVDLSSTREDGPNTVPAPHPNLQNSSKKKK